MAKKNGNAVEVGKTGTFDVSVSYVENRNTPDAQTHNATAQITITPDVISAVRKAVKAHVGQPYVHKASGKTITPTGAHTTYGVGIGGSQKSVFGEVLLAIAETLGMIPTAQTAPTDLTGIPRKLTLKALTAGLEAAGVIVTRSTFGGAMVYLPENAPSGAGGSRMDGKEALAKILAG